jgi:hypothetical protein
MPRGRKPQGGQALSNAQRQARYRARRAVVQPRPTPRGTLRQPRPQRWRAALAELVRLQAEYAAWLEAIPEALKASATAEALEAILNLDLDELSAVNPPRGFGRDS